MIGDFDAFVASVLGSSRPTVSSAGNLSAIIDITKEDGNGSVASAVDSSRPIANMVSSHSWSIVFQDVSKKQPPVAALTKIAARRFPGPLVILKGKSLTGGSSQPTFSSATIDMTKEDNNGSVAPVVGTAGGNPTRKSTVKRKRLVVKRKSTKQGNKKKKRKSNDDPGTRSVFIAQVATIEEMQSYAWRYKDIEIELSKEKIALPPKIFNYWKTGEQVKEIPKNVVALNKVGDTDAGREEFLLGHNTDFVPYPDLNPPIGHTVYKRDDKKQVLAAATRNTLGVVKRRYPRVYFCHIDGFIICCEIGWSCKYAKKEQIESGMVEVLDTRGNQVFIRSYSVIRTHMNYDGYRRVTLYSDGCNKTSKTLFVAHLCLITFKVPRPDGHEGDHTGKRSDNSIDKLRWIPRSANSIKQNINRDSSGAHKNFTTFTLFSDSKCYTSGDHDWFASPRNKNHLISRDGKHVYNKATGKCIPIRQTEYHETGYSKFRISILDEEKGWVTLDYSRFATESFIGRRLIDGETCDHDRSNNSYVSLMPRHMPFQVFNKKIHHQGVREDGSIPGVFRRRNKSGTRVAYWVASIRVLTPDAQTNSREKMEYFSIAEYGDKKALAMAVQYRKHYTLHEGMNFDVERVAPTISKTSR